MCDKGSSVTDVRAVWTPAEAAARAGAGAAGRQRYQDGKPGEPVMAKTLIDIEPELLAQAQQILGARTKKQTVNMALREIVRRWAAQEFSELARSGVFDGLLPVEPDTSAAHPPLQSVEPKERACP